MNNENPTLEDLAHSIEQVREYDPFQDQHSFRKFTTDNILSTMKTLIESITEPIKQKHTFDPFKSNGVDSEKDVNSRASTTEQDMIVHYTDIETLIALFENHPQYQNPGAKSNPPKSPSNGLKSLSDDPFSSLRLYDTAHVNDPDEGFYLARNLLSGDSEDWLRPRTTSHAYLTSFIYPKEELDLARDNLVFWRTYGYEGEGCSISFPAPKTNVWRVIYNRKELNLTIAKLRPIVGVLAQISKFNDQWIEQEVREYFWKSLGIIQYLYKSDAYNYENECRFVVPSSDVEIDHISYEYRPNARSMGSLRHYCEHWELNTNKILASRTVVTIGPCVTYRDDLIAALGNLKRKTNLLGPKIEASDIPYRRT